ncbi:metal-sulfur cluster assembly factor [Paludibacterium purpuratum]|uniref:Metal-sulfur cluster biosynthetic enzyme n=1 Tax=Paludibacterium purpuratum TaxID=1144873 RepID=A0A4R7AW98_9NEIS|nr:metal-sulfur cluster assembly factor [Paludibacterium purpuratum]TDR70615.1 metal-sulfur cluster biosynthetic enzyme [Paludibacterium purpuratum]
MNADTLREALRQVIDPEVGMNIVDLGLIYRLDWLENEVRIEMTMTSPACPMGESIMHEVQTVVHDLVPPAYAVEVSLVWDPPWSPACMSERARNHFGWNG